MRKFLRKTLVYLLAFGLLCPTWLVTGMLSAEHAKAGTGPVTFVEWNFDSESMDPDEDLIGGAYFSGVSGDNAESYYQGNPNTGKAYSLSEWDAEDYYSIAFDSTGYAVKGLSFDSMATEGTGPDTFSVYYSADGVDFTELIGSASVISHTFSANPMHNFDLSSINEISDNPNSEIRLVVKTPGTSNTGGWRIDNIRIFGQEMTTTQYTASLENVAENYVKNDLVNYDELTQEQLNEAVEERIAEKSLVPFNVVVNPSVAGDRGYDDAVISSITGFDNFQFWAEDSSGDWHDLSAGDAVAGLELTANDGISLPIYVISDQLGEYSGWTFDVHDSSTGELIASTEEGSLNIVLEPTTVNASEIGSLLEKGYFEFELDEGGQVSYIDVAGDVIIALGETKITLKAGTEISGVEVGSTFDPSSISAMIPQLSAFSGFNDGVVANGVLQWGIENFGLQFSKPVEIDFFVGEQYNGQTLSIQRSLSNDSDWTSDGIVAPASCTVVAGICSFSADKASYYATTSSVVAPEFTVVAKEVNGEKVIQIEWKGNNSDQYIISVNGKENVVESVSKGADYGHVYSKSITVLSAGSYKVSMVAVRSGVFSVNSVVRDVVFASPAAVEETSAPAPAPVVTVGPTKAQAAAPAETATPVTPDDQNGKIKGDESQDDDNADEKINWTPWIVLFVLIILAGAATGGYFYWFSGEDEVNAVVREPKKTEKKVVENKKAQNSKAKQNKKSKRW